MASSCVSFYKLFCRMGKWPVSNIMKQRSSHQFFLFLLIHLFYKMPCKVVYTERMFKPCVVRSWIYKVGKTKLPNSPESLNLWRIYQSKGKFIKLDIIVNRVAYHFH